MADIKNVIKEGTSDRKEFRKEFQLLNLETETLKGKYETTAKENETINKEIKYMVQWLEKDKWENSSHWP